MTSTESWKSSKNKQNTDNYQLSLLNSQLTIDVVRKDIKNIHLGVYPPEGRVRIASPLKKGDRYLLNVIYHQAPPKVVIRNKTYIDLYVRYGSIQEQREQVLTNWYRQQLKAELPHLIAKWEKIIGVTINDWGVKKMKTKWGTCNIQDKRIWLNLELIKKPTHCLEYVIVHELVHLLERHHSDHFEAYMSKFMPNWSFYKDELNCFPLLL